MSVLEATNLSIRFGGVQANRDVSIAIGEYEQALPAFGVSEFRHTVGELQQMGRLLGESNRAREAAESRLTERNEELSTIFSLSPDGLVSFDAGGLLTETNPAFLALTGWSRDELIGRNAGIGIRKTVFPRFHAAEPRHFDIAMGLGGFGRFVPQTGDDRQVLPERRQRLEDRRHRIVGTGFLRHPSVHDRAVRETDKGEPLRCLAGRGLGPCGCCGVHCIEKRKSDAGTNAL